MLVINPIFVVHSVGSNQEIDDRGQIDNAFANISAADDIFSKGYIGADSVSSESALSVAKS